MLRSNHTPRLLTVVVVLTLECPVAISSRDTLSSCCRVPFTKNSVFTSFSLSLSFNIYAVTTLIQLSIDVTASVSLKPLSGWKDEYSWESSAQACAIGRQVLTTSKSLLAYMVNSSGPKQEPCGTPRDNSVLSEYAPSKITCCERSDHISAESVIQKIVWIICSKILWSTVSNATLKSSATNNVTCLRFML